jgi:hypothetical protein
LSQRFGVADVSCVEALHFRDDVVFVHRFDYVYHRVEGVFKNGVPKKLFCFFGKNSIVHTSHIESRHVGLGDGKVSYAVFDGKPDCSGGVIDDYIGAAFTYFFVYLLKYFRSPTWCAVVFSGVNVYNAGSGIYGALGFFAQFNRGIWYVGAVYSAGCCACKGCGEYEFFVGHFLKYEV